MSAPDVFKVAPAYQDPEQNAIDKRLIQTDAWLAHDMVYFDHPSESQKILLDWALHCREVQGSEGGLVMTFKGFSFLWAWWIMRDLDWNKQVFLPWVEVVYRPCAWEEQAHGKENNRASWGILGCVLADMILREDLGPWMSRVDRNMNAAIAEDGAMKIEVLRTNMGIWYAVFALSAMLRVCQLLDHPNIGKLQKPLWWLWQYIVDPGSWPYRPGRWPVPWWPWPKLERIVHPTTDELDLPRANDEAGALYLAAGRQFGVNEWVDYARPWPGCTPFPGVNCFRWVE